MVPGKFPAPGRPPNLGYSRAGPIALAVGAGGGCSVVVVVLLFYVHGKHLRSCRDGQLT